ncbi:MAG: AEC family transporter [Clostridia bacterium]|nr:AEC family transporter [Clostridia bacterium]
MFLTTIEQVSLLIILIFVGYYFRKKGIINEQGRKVIASLLVNLFAPAYSIMSLSTIINVHDIQKYAILLVAGVVFALFSIFLAIPLAKATGKDKFHRNIYKYAFAFGNIGYFGYPLVNAVFGAVARAQMILFCVPLSVGISSYGYYILTEPVALDGQLVKEKEEIGSKLKRIFSPPMFASIIGISLGLITSGFNFKLPVIVTDLLTVVGNCQSAPAMLIAGAALASVPFKKLLSSFKAYVVGALRLIGMPLIISGLMALIYLFGWRDANFMRIAFFSIVCASMPVGMNVVVYPESAGMDSTEGARTCFISYILAIVVLPSIFSILTNVLSVTF